MTGETNEDAEVVRPLTGSGQAPGGGRGEQRGNARMAGCA